MSRASLQTLTLATWLAIASVTTSGCTSKTHSEKDGPAPASPQKAAASAKPPRGALELIRAIAQGRDDEATQWIRDGVDVNQSVVLESGESVTPLMAAVVNGNKAIASLLLRNGASPQPIFQGYTSFDFAAYLEDAETAALIQELSTQIQ